MMDANTQLCCLLGNPVGHSLSPLIHNTLAEELGLNMNYMAFKVENDRLQDVVKGAYGLGIIGMNVTVPHKCSVIPYLTEIDPLAQKINAVNTLVRIPKGYKGYNTDIIGLERELIEEGITIEGNEFIILGAGGASNAITYLCAARKASRVWLLNRTYEKAETLAKEVNSEFGDIVTPLLLSDYDKIPKKKYVVIQTTSVGLHPNDDCAPIENDDFYELAGAGIDIIFNPAKTKFMKKCEEHGAATANGLKMLLYQGIAAFELWYDVKIEDRLSEKVLKILQEKMEEQS